MDSSLTLHDFVLNLLTDADARAAFQLDPDGSLSAAGLGGVSPADVRDLIPLVADYAPVHLSTLDAGLPDFGASPLGADRADAVAQVPIFGAAVPTVPALASPALATAGGLSAVATGAVGLAGTSAATLGGVGSLVGDTGLGGQLGLDPSGGGLSGGADASGHAGLSGDQRRV